MADLFQDGIKKTEVVNTANPVLLLPGETGVFEQVGGGGNATFSSSGTTLTGVGTKWDDKNQLNVGDYIQSGNEIRRVSIIRGPELAEIDEAFTVDVAPATDFKRLIRRRYKSVNVTTLAGTPSINGIPMAAGSAENFEPSDDGFGVGPLVITGSDANSARVRYKY